jgi:uncharacterized YigZ family protein
MTGFREQQVEEPMQEKGLHAIYRSGTGELEEKKSRFLGFVYGVESEEAVALVLEEMRKKYWDARHVCYAYVLGERGEQQRFSDDGEPSGTAGKPMLDVLTGAAVTNALVVVVRYFGGVLLGTGGLVRAYSGAAKDALEHAVIITRQAGKELCISLDYTAFGKVQYLLNQEELTISETTYADNVLLKLPVPMEDLERIKKKIMDITNGTADIEEGDPISYAVVDQQIVYL